MNYESLQQFTKQERKECTKLAVTLHGKQEQNMSVLSKGEYKVFNFTKLANITT